MSAEPTILEALAEIADDLVALSKSIHANPEMGYREVKACAWQVELLRKWGFEVETPYAGMDTAYCARRGSGAPVFGLLAEYDALPEIGHGCGHNLICSCALGAGKALADALERAGRPGVVVVVGTPAEESYGGKIVMAEQGCFDAMDAVIMAHPSSQTQAWYGALGVTHYEIAYRGAAAHAGVCPEKGRNALDAVMLLFAGVNAWRQHLPEDTRLHGIVTEGGAAPNIVPARAACSFYVRANDMQTLAEMEQRFERIAGAAAVMADVVMELKITSRYKPGQVNEPLNRAYHELAEKMGLHPVVPPRGGRGSTDFGDVSQESPGTHVYFGICDKDIPSHSPAFAAAAGSDFAQQQMLKAAELLAGIGYRFFTDAAFRNEVTGRRTAKPERRVHSKKSD